MVRLHFSYTTGQEYNPIKASKSLELDQMLIYFLIGLALVLVSIVGLQFSYLYFIDRLFTERKRYLRNLEHQNARLAKRLEVAERSLDEQKKLIDTMNPEIRSEDDSWADVIEES